MAGSNSSVHGGNHGDGEPPVSRAELNRMADSLVEAMGRMFDERLPAIGGRGPHRHDPEEFYREESEDENSGFGHGFDLFGDGRGGYGGGRRADFNNPRGRHHAPGHRVRFEDEEFDDYDREEGSDENPFANGEMFGRRHHHRRADREHHHERRHRNDPDNIA